ncbi:MAG: potassium transporter TrkA [Deltaproteobacteria bacterium]|nr:potassium transporter TrkA [Deltaproteobacteria bacterium]
MNDFSTRERMRYAFDNTLAKGTIALIAWLAVVTLGAIAFFAAILAISGFNNVGEAEGLSFIEAAWGSLMRTFDAGNMAGDTGWPYRIVTLCVTLIGIFVMSTLIGVLSSGLEAQIEELRKGRSRVVEKDHTVILGWSEQIFPILTELIEANTSRKNAAIVILGAKDKVEMEDEIRDKISDFKGTSVICRTGSPVEIHDLHIVSIDSARSIIVLAPDDEEGGKSEDPDVDVIKALLAVTNSPDRKKGKYHLVAEVRDPKNVQVAEMIGKDEVELVLVGDLIARIMAQTCRQSGLSVVYTELLDFGGVEIYFKEEPQLANRKFAECLLAHEDSAVIGIRPANGRPVLNPPMNTVIGAGDRLIVVAEDDDAIVISGSVAKPDASLIALVTPPPPTPERSLILGWNWRGPHVINELDNYVPPGSSVQVVADSETAESSIEHHCSALSRQTLTFQKDDTTDRGVLDALKVGTFQHVIVLCYSDDLPVAKADAKTLITLLHLRDIASKTGVRVSVVSEMLDITNRRLAEVTNADDFIVSDRLVSLMMSQISENKDLNIVFKDLFSPDGSEVYLKPVVEYVKPGIPVTFATLIAAAAQKGEVAFGYKVAADATNAQKSYGVVVSPKKSQPITFAPGDKLIVLAEN